LIVAFDSEQTVQLLGRPRVMVDGVGREVPTGSQRLLAFVALHPARLERGYVAGMLWPTGGDVRAIGNLRSALWRLRTSGIDVIGADKHTLVLAPRARVDVHAVAAWAGRLISGEARPDDLDLAAVPAEACRLFPGWRDDWAVLERERLRQRVLHAMEALSVQLARQGRHTEAVAAGRRAVDEQPLRESAQRALVAAHLERGDRAAAQAAYADFADLVRRTLGVEPSQRIADLAAQTPSMATNADSPVGGARSMSALSRAR
jgi:DNA-binding SARP family transcriptional activator